MALLVSVFVKTPGVSAVKTRLAATLGRGFAEEFHWRCARAVAGVLQRSSAVGTPAIVPHWAVAEPHAHGHWPELPTLSQGEGALGARLATVYATLLSTRVPATACPVLLGADAPQLQHQHLVAVHTAFKMGATFVVGPASDGGFWLMAGRVPVPAPFWEQVTYSSGRTVTELVAVLSSLGSVQCLDMLRDGDEATDLPEIIDALRALANPVEEQQALLTWLEENCRRP